MTSLSNVAVAARIHQALAPLQVVPVDAELPGETSIGRVRRRGRTSADDDVGILTLLDVDGVLLWEDGAVSTSTAGRRRRGAGPAIGDGEVVTQLKYQKPLGANRVIDQLHALDTSFTPRAAAATPPGAQLLEYDTTTWTATPIAAPAAQGRILLLIHGTFSSSEKLVADLALNPAFLARVAAAGYTQIVGFDHFTVSRSPFVNAAELARLFARSGAKLDIVCHSRGGLVARWFAELLDRRPARKRRIVFVGCPLQGTSLADPQSLRHGLTLMTNVGKVLGAGFGLVPFLAAASGLMQIFTSIGSFTARSPLVDVGVGLLPGISAMSRIDKNAELNVLNHGSAAARNNYFAVCGAFKTEDVGWRFWRLFNKLAAADLAADYLVFESDNDLVVDTSSMTHHVFGAAPNFKDFKRFCVFDANSGVHHTSYFRHPDSLAFIAKAFALKG
jgi:pimeloyl-ACP methyl ester carboxylesterase